MNGIREFSIEFGRDLFYSLLVISKVTNVEFVFKAFWRTSERHVLLNLMREIPKWPFVLLLLFNKIVLRDLIPFHCIQLGFLRTI